MEEEPMHDPAALTVDALTHRYGRTLALDGVDLTVQPGECVALLGPNGAGKTTLVNAAVGLVAPQRGHVRVVGADPRQASTRRHLGVVQQQVGHPRTLQVGELVRGAAVRHRVPAAAADAVLAEVGLQDLVRRRTHRLSGGQQQRLQLAVALVGDPRLLVLDEPTVGLDAGARRAFWQLLAARKAAGTGILLTTHLIEESSTVADRVVVLDRGRVVADTSPDQLRTRLPDRRVTCRTHLDAAELRRWPHVLGLETDGDLVHLATRTPEALLRELLAADADLDRLRVEAASLEDAVVALTAGPDVEVAA